MNLRVLVSNKTATHRTGYSLLPLGIKPIKEMTKT